MGKTSVTTPQPNPADSARTSASLASGFTARAVLLGCVFSFFVAAGDAYGTFYLIGSFMALGTSTVGAIFLLFLLTGLVNPLLKLIQPRLGLNRQELLLIYVMMVMASPIPTLFAGRIFGTILAPYYFATPENNWHNLIQPYLPGWMSPQNPRLPALFYEGLEQGRAIPWADWAPTFLVWLPLVWALFLMMMVPAILLRKQWIEHERLIYPLVQVPLAMTEQGDAGKRFGSFYKNPVMWAGFAVPALWGTLHGLHTYFPNAVPIAQDVDLIYLIVPIFRGASELQFKFRFNILGFFYFVKTDIAFSFWFFNLFANALRGAFGILGVTSSETLGGGNHIASPILLHQAVGGMLMLFAGTLWTARKHLRAVLRKAFLGDAQVDDSGEILSYRSAVVLLLVASLVLVGWLWLAGMPLWVALAVLFLAAVLIVGYTRLVAESGLSDGALPGTPVSILISAVGCSALGTQGLVLVATTYFWTSGVRSFVMTSCANSLKMGEELAGRKRPLFWVMILAMAIGLVSSIWTVMVLSHKYGALNLMQWIVGWQGGYDYLEPWLSTPTTPHLWGWINTGIGAGFMALLMAARWRYAWWPVHPLGYPLGATVIMDHLWFNMFLAWAIKVLVLKYGGVGLYQKTRPFFLGMIAGHIVPGGIFLFVDHFTGMTGNPIFWG